MVDFVRSDYTLVLRGFETTDEVDLQPFVDAFEMVISDTQVDGIVFYVDESFK